MKEQACLGACILAAVGCGLLDSLKEGCDRFVRMSDRIYEPDRTHFAVYEERYETFKSCIRAPGTCIYIPRIQW